MTAFYQAHPTFCGFLLGLFVGAVVSRGGFLLLAFDLDDWD